VRLRAASASGFSCQTGSVSRWRTSSYEVLGVGFLMPQGQEEEARKVIVCEERFAVFLVEPRALDSAGRGYRSAACRRGDEIEDRRARLDEVRAEAQALGLGAKPDRRPVDAATPLRPFNPPRDRASARGTGSPVGVLGFASYSVPPCRPAASLPSRGPIAHDQLTGGFHSRRPCSAHQKSRRANARRLHA
jgi:hypothetical protein